MLSFDHRITSLFLITLGPGGSPAKWGPDLAQYYFCQVSRSIVMSRMATNRSECGA